MVDIECRVKGCRCVLELAASVELLIHTNNGQAVCKCHPADDAHYLAVEPFHCIPQQRAAGEAS